MSGFCRIAQAAQNSFWDAIDQAENLDLKRDLLEEAMRSTSSDVKVAALDELLDLPGSVALESMIPAMSDPDERVAEEAQFNVEFITSEEFETEEQAQAWFEENKVRLQEEEAEMQEFFAAPETSDAPSFIQMLKSKRELDVSSE